MFKLYPSFDQHLRSYYLNSVMLCTRIY